MSLLVFVLTLVLLGCPAPSAVDAGLPQLYARVERVANGLPEASVETAGLLRVLDDGRVVSPVDTGSGVIGALRLRAADGRVTTLTVPPAEDGGQFSFFEDDGNYGGFADAPARGWAVFDGGLHEYVGAGGPAVACRTARCSSRLPARPAKVKLGLGEVSECLRGSSW